MKYTIENIHTGFILGIFEAESEKQAFEMMAKEAGYKSINDIPNFKKEELNIYETS